MAAAPSTKRALIDKANASIVAYVSVAVFILIFSLVAVKVLVSQAAYQNRVISKKRVAVNQLKTDIHTSAQLKTAYTAFTSTAQNAIGGDPKGSGPKDGNNAKIVLDALPSSYDFPGLTTSLENLLAGKGVKIEGIGGTDDEVAQSANQTSTTPTPVPIPFTLSVSGPYDNIRNVVDTLGNSIRPMQLQTLELTGTSNNLTLNITAQTYYQPAKSLNINKQVVK